MMKIYCCTCKQEVEVKLVKGHRVYSHRKDLHSLPFWMCLNCGCFVGCHHKTKTPTKPLGCIPSGEIKNARQHIHKILDPLWKSKRFKRKDLYHWLSKELGYEYHTAEIRCIEEARKIYRLIKRIKDNG